jgi:group I intron endonuclease
MGFIYKITNNINQKSYIGKTERNISVRYKEHIRHKNYLDLPLYRAFNKYGIENFSIS